MIKQKTLKHFIMSTVLLLGVFITLGRTGPTVEASSGAVVRKVTSVNKLTGSKTIKLAKGKKAYLKTTVTVMPDRPENKKVTYKSSNNKVATVTSQGMITGKKPGTAKITVTSVKNKKRKATVNVTVLKGRITNIFLFGRHEHSLKKGETVKLKPDIITSAGGSKDVVWTTTNKKVAKVDKNGKIKAVGNGEAYIIATAADGTGVSHYFQVTVNNYKTKYKYEVKFLHQPYNTSTTFIYVKTKNPSAEKLEVKLCTMDGKVEDWRATSLKGHADLKNIGAKSGDFYKVKGGYLGKFVFAPNTNPGKHKVRIEEYGTKGLKGYDNLGYIDIRNLSKEREKWKQSVVKKATTNSMTKKEKMEAITKYMYDNSVYLKSRSDKVGYAIHFAADVGLPFWKIYPYEFDSMTSPAMLVEFGDMIGYPLKSLYGKYKYGTPEWNYWHMVAESVEDGSHYKFCHTYESNIVDVSNIKQIDLSKWKFYECYK